jgi:hypothetical protein
VKHFPAGQQVSGILHQPRIGERATGLGPVMLRPPWRLTVSRCVTLVPTKRTIRKLPASAE